MPSQLIGLLGDTRSAKLLPVLTPVTLLHDQSLVPLQEGVGCHEGCRFLEALAAEWVEQHHKPLAVGIGEAQPAVATELGFEDTVFRKGNVMTCCWCRCNEPASRLIRTWRIIVAPQVRGRDTIVWPSI